MSQQADEPQVEQGPPIKLTSEYAQFLQSSNTALICMVEAPDKRQAIYLERSLKPDAEGTCRIFFKETDVQAYMQVIATFHEGSPLKLMQAEIDLDELTEVISIMDKKNITSGGKGFNIVASGVYENAMYNIDIFGVPTREI